MPQGSPGCQGDLRQTAQAPEPAMSKPRAKTTLNAAPAVAPGPVAHNPMAPSPVTSSGCTCFKLRSLARRVTQLYDQAMAPSGLKVTQYSLLAHARLREGAAPLSVSALADALFTERTTLTRNLKPLVQAGYLRIASGADARTKAVCVTAAGEAAFQAARPLWRAAQARVDALVGAERLGALHGLIGQLLPVLEAGQAAHGAAAPYNDQGAAAPDN